MSNRYAPAFAAYVGSLMAAASGVPARVATVWALSESGGATGPAATSSATNNPYGVTVGGQLASYPSLQAGVDAAAQLLRTAPQYRGVQAVLPSGNAQAIADAIVASPWAAQPGQSYSVYYAQTWPKLGLSVSAPGSGASHAAPPSRAGGPPPVAGATGSAPISGAANPPSLPTDSGQPTSAQPTRTPLTVASGLFGSLFAWVPGVLGDLVILVLVLILLVEGLHLLDRAKGPPTRACRPTSRRCGARGASAGSRS